MAINKGLNEVMAVRYLSLLSISHKYKINHLTEWQVSVTCRLRPPLTHLFLTDEQLITLQNHKPVLPDLSEDSFPAELPDPADLLGLNVLLRGVLRTLNTGNRKQEAVRGVRSEQVISLTLHLKQRHYCNEL